jgi:hypothetical protein
MRGRVVAGEGTAQKAMMVIRASKCDFVRARALPF